ncbi:hypothetical protein AJ79_00260 [Helicocarpus griseus UAMH5409]|uniref:Uncharacterized protein n=1 Tax=Helicocarpus griseus UAMH5409 TaxID=1447875 RepID=A0A2B7YE15_9EURO|nr:hypothetical protein AJ79_00260 [Helicocarpus griseus UAMH5409]
MPGVRILRLVFLWLATLFCIWAEPGVLKLGNLDQYKGIENGGSALSGEKVWISGKEGSGFDFAFSPDLQAKIYKTLESSCKDADHRCYQEVRDLLGNSALEINQGLERRAFIHMLAKDLKKLRNFFSWVASFLAAAWLERHTQLGNFLHLPENKASEAATALDAPKVTIFGSNSPIMTITPIPDPTTLTGAVTPAVTPVSTAFKDFQPGDMVITLEKSLASRVDEILRRTTADSCEDGMKFESESSRKRADSYAAAVCAAEGVIHQTVQGGPFSDLLLLNAPTIAFAPGDLAHGAQLVVNFMRDYSALLDISSESIEPLAQVIFAFALNVVIDNVPLGTENRVRQSRLAGTTTAPPTKTTETTSCGSTSACEASCKGVGAMFYYCETSCTPTTACQTGTATNEQSVTTVTTKAWAGPAAVAAHPTATPNGDPKCDTNKPGAIPSDVFYGPRRNMASKFCEEVKKNHKTSLTWMVDIEGNMIPRMRRRGLPVKREEYDDYKTSLRWEPVDDFKPQSCAKDCMESFKGIAESPCGHTGSNKDEMALEGSWDIGCGKYSWSISRPPKEEPEPEPEPRPEPNKKPMELGPQKCFEKDDFPGHKDVSPTKIDYGAWDPDTCPRDLKLHPRSVAWETTKHEHLVFRNEWKANCITDVDEQSVLEPLGDILEGNAACPLLLLNNWKNCNNGGAGGWIEAGCLIYTFHPKGGKK